MDEGSIDFQHAATDTIAIDPHFLAQPHGRKALPDCRERLGEEAMLIGERALLTFPRSEHLKG